LNLKAVVTGEETVNALEASTVPFSCMFEESLAPANLLPLHAVVATFHAIKEVCDVLIF
jgi:hypothetical protein